MENDFGTLKPDGICKVSVTLPSIASEPEGSGLPQMCTTFRMSGS